MQIDTRDQVHVRLANDGRSWVNGAALGKSLGDRALHALLRSGWHIVDVENYDGYESLVIMERDGVALAATGT